MFGRSWWTGLIDTPAYLAALTTVAAVTFVVLRVNLVAHGDISRFIGLGSDFSNPSQVPPGVTVAPGAGYDGQFYYRLALDPANLHRRAFGIGFDSDARVQRIMYPALAWLGAAGQQRFIPDALVGINVAALGVMAWFSALIARESQRRAAWGLLIVAYFGFLFSLGRDLTEICEACFLLGGLLAWRRQRPVTAGALLAASVLSLETALVVVVAMALVSVVQIVTRRRGPGWVDLAWIMPGAAYVAWQVVGWVITGELPLRADTGDNLSYPFVAMADATGHYVRLLPSSHSLIWIGEFVVLVIVACLAASSMRRAKVPAHEKVAFAFSLLLAACLTKSIWYGHADFRGFDDVYLLSSVVLLGSERRLRILAALVVVAWAATFIHRLFFF
jgi:hypothetical protein